MLVLVDMASLSADLAVGVAQATGIHPPQRSHLWHLRVAHDVHALVGGGKAEAGQALRGDICTDAQRVQALIVCPDHPMALEIQVGQHCPALLPQLRGNKGQVGEGGPRRGIRLQQCQACHVQRSKWVQRSGLVQVRVHRRRQTSGAAADAAAQFMIAAGATAKRHAADARLVLDAGQRLHVHIQGVPQQQAQERVVLHATGQIVLPEAHELEGQGPAQHIGAAPSMGLGSETHRGGEEELLSRAWGADVDVPCKIEDAQLLPQLIWEHEGVIARHRQPLRNREFLQGHPEAFHNLTADGLSEMN
mmetsp:Transcript_52373/g.168781  ORF Transcript_52373/g.168781 Transcript_52373/m.168781 type:complete len:305 (-) Transcript_52373:298-1212(-)